MSQSLQNKRGEDKKKGGEKLAKREKKNFIELQLRMGPKCAYLFWIV